MKQMGSGPAGGGEEGGLGPGLQDLCRSLALDGLCCLSTQTENRSAAEPLQSVFSGTPPFVRQHQFPKHHQCVGNKHELLRSAFINC